MLLGLSRAQSLVLTRLDSSDHDSMLPRCSARCWESVGRRKEVHQIWRGTFCPPLCPTAQKPRNWQKREHTTPKTSASTCNAKRGVPTAATLKEPLVPWLLPTCPQTQLLRGSTVHLSQHQRRPNDTCLQLRARCTSILWPGSELPHVSRVLQKGTPQLWSCCESLCQWPTGRHGGGAGQTPTPRSPLVVRWDKYVHVTKLRIEPDRCPCLAADPCQRPLEPFFFFQQT